MSADIIVERLRAQMAWRLREGLVMDAAELQSAIDLITQTTERQRNMTTALEWIVNEGPGSHPQNVIGVAKEALAKPLVTSDDEQTRRAFMDEALRLEKTGAVATVTSYTNGSYWRNYQLSWHRDVPEGTRLYDEKYVTAILQQALVTKVESMINNLSPPTRDQTQLVIADRITVFDLAQKLSVNSGDLVRALFKMGVMATVNQTIDYSTAAELCASYGRRVTKHQVG